MNSNIICRGVLSLAFLAVLTQGVAGETLNVPRFAGNSYIDIGTPDALQLPSNEPFTIEAWVRVETWTKTAIIYAKNNDRRSDYTYMFGLTGTGTKMSSYTGAGGAPANIWREVDLPSKIDLNVWHHLAYVYDGKSLHYYYDGNLLGSTVYSFGNYSAHNVKIGGHANGNDLQGNIAYVRVWNHARSARQVEAYRPRRLTGAEPGLVGYWPLDEGTGTTAFDGTGNDSKGTLSGATWATTTDLDLATPRGDYTFAVPFELGNIKTGSTRFTNSNQVEIASLPIPDGCDYYQITDGGAVSNIASGGWVSTNTAPGIQTFDWPASDTNIVFYTWYTNSTVTAMVHRATGTIYYTTALPVPSVRATLARQKRADENVVIYGLDLDDGSTGGTANGVTLDIHALAAAAVNPAHDLTPEEPYVTLADESAYPLLLAVWNEAGNAAMGVATCQVTITTYTGTNLWTGAGGNDLWHNGANWSAGVPAAGQDVVIKSGSGTRLTAPTAAMNSFELGAGRSLTFEGWQSAIKATEIQIKGTITHAFNDVPVTDSQGQWIPQHRILIEGSNVTVASAAELDADWKGYRIEQGPGAPIGVNGGAGHAGQGGHGDAFVGGAAYGMPDTPTQPGSGAGFHANSSEGGGAIRVMAAGQLSIYGTIKANGRNALSTHGGGGSGGSIWLTCRTLAGSALGIVQARGGNGSYYGGAGAAGRIAINYHQLAQNALPEPRPAIRLDGTPGFPTQHNKEQLHAPMATLYLPDTLLVASNFSAQRLQYVQLHVADWSEWALDTMTLDDCIVGVEDGIDVSIMQDLVLTNNGALYLFAAPVTNVLTDTGANLSVGGSLYVNNDSWIIPVAHPTNGATVKMSVEGDLLIDEYGGIDADLRGYTRTYGPGTPNKGGGSGHGGHGGMGFGGAIYGDVYGDAALPIQAGSGGNSATHAGRGGGAIRLQVAGRALIDGTLTAKGGQGTATHGPAGAGGSILVQCNTLEGSHSGLLAVDGGLGNYYGGSSGGGRIAVHYDTVAQAALSEPVPSIRFSAYSYPFTSYKDTKFTINAQDGTLWLPDMLFITETLAQQRFWHVRLAIPGVDAWSFNSLTLDNCVLTWPVGFTLSVTNDLVLTNGAAFTLVAAATNSPLQRYGSELIVGNDLTVAPDCWIYPQAQPTNAAIVGMLVGGNATLMTGGGIDAAGRGYQASSAGQIGPGEGANGYQGGGYGGKGGGTAGGTTYGSAALPLRPGSAAGWNGYGGADGYNVGGSGGGAVHMRVGRELHVDGLVSADGQHGSYYGGGGGSGGAIFLAARRLTGSGTLRAKGGSSSRSFAAGGGGRIAIWHHISPADVEKRLAARCAASMVYTANHVDFKDGTLEVEWYGSSENGLPEEGSKGFYTQPSTLLIIR